MDRRDNHTPNDFSTRSRPAGSVAPAALSSVPDPTTPSSASAQQIPSRERPSNGELRTLFVSGVPADVQEREIHILFRFFPGYEGCSISRTEGKQPICFASFLDAASAGRARDALQGFKFEPSATYPLRIEFARSNSKVKRLPRDYLEGDFRKRLSVTVSDVTPTSYGAPPVAPQGYPNPFLPWLNQPDSTPQFAFSPYVNAAPSNAAGKPLSSPVTTLFVGNLATDVQRNDLTRLFYLSDYLFAHGDHFITDIMPGFKELRMTFRKEHPIAFVEFADVNAAMNAMKALQGAPIGSSRIRIEFAKKKTTEGGAQPAEKRMEGGEEGEEGQTEEGTAEGQDY